MNLLLRISLLGTMRHENNETEGTSVHMNKAIVLAEKPSVAREIAKVIGAHKRARGYIEGPSHIVTWALGHLIELSEPAAYSPNYKRWTLSSLPMLPQELTLEVMKGTQDQYEIVSSLMHRDDVDSLIIATDAGREGELVARWIMKKAGWKGDVKRLWISSQTRQAIEDGFSSLKPAELFDGLYRAGEARSAADWYVGMNVTRALTCRFNSRLSAGRVQTPTLALMCEREDEREAHEGSIYWTVRANLGLFSASLHDEEGVMKVPSMEKLDQIVSDLDGRDAAVQEVVTQEVKDQPPLAYDLTELQRDANTILSYSAKETLDILQRLYEVHKIVTYPRTDSRYITEDIVPTLSGRLHALKDTDFGQLSMMYLDHGFPGDLSRFVSETDVTDHHAIIPTEQKVDLKVLNEKEKHLWALITLRFLEVLSADYIYDSSAVVLSSAGYTFKTRFITKKQNGWRDMRAFAPEALKKGEKEDLLGDDALPASVAAGASFTIRKVRTRKVSDRPPERYSEATLLSAMEHAGRFVDEADMKKSLKGGIGTPATRADIIEKLIQNHYIEREGRHLVPTSYGRELIRLAPEMLRSPLLTAQWESRLSAISDGSHSYESFISDIKKETASLVSSIAQSRERFSPQDPDAKICPYCSKPMIKARDNEGRVHNICLALNCSYEEMLVPPRTTRQVSVKRVKTGAGGRERKVVVKTSDAPPAVPVTVEVVRESKMRARPAHGERLRKGPRKGDDTRQKSEQRPKNTPRDTSMSTGATFADLLAESERRKKDRDRKKKR